MKAFQENIKTGIMLVCIGIIAILKTSIIKIPFIYELLWFAFGAISLYAGSHLIAKNIKR